MRTLFISPRNRYLDQKLLKKNLFKRNLQQLWQRQCEAVAVLGNTLGLAAVLVLAYVIATGVAAILGKFSG